MNAEILERQDYTTQEIVDFCKENGIDNIPISDCSMCGYRCGYVFQGDKIYYDPGCGCCSGEWTERSFEDLDYTLQMNSSDKPHRKDKGLPGVTMRIMADLEEIVKNKSKAE